MSASEWECWGMCLVQRIGCMCVNVVEGLFL